MEPVTLRWEKYIKAKHLDENRDFLENNGGVYLFVWNGKRKHVCYVGETGENFAERFKSHFQNILGGAFSFPYIGIADDYITYMKEHFHGQKPENILKKNKYHLSFYKDKKFDFQKPFLDHERISASLNFIKNLEFAFCLLDNDSQISRREIEAALIVGLKKEYFKLKNCTFQLKDMLSKANLLGQPRRYPERDFLLSHTGKEMSELPKEVLNIGGYKRDDRYSIYNRESK